MKIRLIYSLFLLLMISQSASASNVPTNITLSATQTTITVGWSGDSSADGYYVYWDTSSNNLDSHTGVSQSLRQYTITGLVSSTTYYVAVSSYNNSVESDLSTIESITTAADTTYPSTPTGLSITKITDIKDDSVSLKWNKNPESDLDHYNIYYSTTSGSYEDVIETDDATFTSITVTGLIDATRYYCTITAVYPSGNDSEKSDELIVDTLVDTIPPYSPKSLTAALSGSHSITVTIVNGNSQMADYKGNILYYGNVSGNLDKQVDLGNSFTYTIGDLPMGSVWFFSASSYDFSGNVSTTTSQVSATVEKTLQFLNQPKDFDGGCFISTAADGTRSCLPLYFLMVGSLALLMIRNNLLKYLRVGILICILSIAFAGISNADEPENPGNNIIGVSMGYYQPLESDFKDYYDKDMLPVYVFYERSFSGDFYERFLPKDYYERFFLRNFSLDIESGFLKEKGHLLTESGDKTDIQTKLTLVPVSASLKFNMKIVRYVVGYIGVGPDYWYCQEKTGYEFEHPKVEEWVGGFHCKAGVRLYNTDEKFKGTGALVETSYSQIDRFGSNKTDIGGWAFKFGIFYHF